MSDVKEYVRTKTLDKGRVSTTINLFMIDGEVFERIAMAFIRGELSSIETREGVAIKCPEDKYNKKIAKDLAMSRLTKKRIDIESIECTGKTTTIYTDVGWTFIYKMGKVNIHYMEALDGRW